MSLVLNTNAQIDTSILNQQVSSYPDISAILIKPSKEIEVSYYQTSGYSSSVLVEPEIVLGMNGNNYGALSNCGKAELLGSSISSIQTVNFTERYFLDGVFDGGEVIGKRIIGQLFAISQGAYNYTGSESKSETATISTTLTLSVYLYHSDGTKTKVGETVVASGSKTGQIKSQGSGGILLYDGQFSYEIFTNGVVALQGDMIGVEINSSSTWNGNAAGISPYQYYLSSRFCFGQTGGSTISLSKNGVQGYSGTCKPLPVQISID